MYGKFYVREINSHYTNFFYQVAKILTGQSGTELSTLMG